MGPGKGCKRLKISDRYVIWVSQGVHSSDNALISPSYSIRVIAGTASPPRPMSTQAAAAAKNQARTPSRSATGAARIKPRGAVIPARLPTSEKTLPWNSGAVVACKIAWIGPLTRGIRTPRPNIAESAHQIAPAGASPSAKTTPPTAGSYFTKSRAGENL